MSDNEFAGANLDDSGVAVLDQEDRARVLATFRGITDRAARRLHFVRASSDGLAPAYVFDDESGMVYILD